MVRKIADILQEKERTYSFEFFPPKTPKGMEKLLETAKTLKELDPDWFAVTYGAGGSTRELTMDIVDQLQRDYDVSVMHHLTCGGHTKDDIRALVDEMKKRGICNILALRGDPPEGVTQWESVPDGLDYTWQLCEFIRSHYGNSLSIGVAGFPEGHIDCPDKETDAKYLKMKMDVGGEFVITQLFFDNQDYFEYVERVRKIGVKARIIPGIIPITGYQKLLRFCGNCGATIPQKVHDIFKPLDGDDEATYKAGVEFVTQQCNELFEGGAPGLHFFSLNKVEPTREILSKIKN